MARDVKRRKIAGRPHGERKVEKKHDSIRLPFTVHNYILFCVGIVLLILGYIFLSIGPRDSIWSLTIAPITLLISYLIVFPLSFLYQHKPDKDNLDTPEMKPHEAI